MLRAHENHDQHGKFFQYDDWKDVKPALTIENTMFPEEREERLKWNHIVIWQTVFRLFSRNVPYLLNFSVPL